MFFDVCYHVHNVSWFWFKHTGNFGVTAAWLLPPWHQCTLYVRSEFQGLYAAKSPIYMQLILVSLYVASTLCRYYWMFSFSDALPMQTYPSKVWFLCVAVQISVRHNLFPTALFFCMKSVVNMADTLKMMTSYLSNVPFNSWIWFSAQLWTLRHVISDLIRLLWPNRLGRADFHSAWLVNPFRDFVCVPELAAGDARQ